MAFNTAFRFVCCILNRSLEMRGVSLSPSSRFQEQSPPPRPEAYPIPTQTYAREYFTFPASKSQDRVAPSQHQWADYEEKPRVHVDGSHSSIGVQVRGAPRHSSGSESRVDGRVRIW